MKQQRFFKVRDLRQKEKFVVDDVYLNGYAKVFGPTVSAIYISLCRHANKDQEAWPSEKKLAEEWNFSIRTSMRAIKKLKMGNLIDIEQVRTEKGKWLNNTYILLDKSEWKSPEDIGVIRLPVGQIATKREDISVLLRKHKEKETHTISNASVAETKDEINPLIELFKDVNPSYERLFGNKTEREAMKRLLKKLGREKLEAMITFLPKNNATKFAPTITTPYMLEKKMGDLGFFWKKERSSSNTAIII